MKSFWDERYSEPGLAYGPDPNLFIKSFLDKHEPGRILFPAEGQGRNAIYAAIKGWKVDAFDYSEIARQKALQESERAGVQINYWVEEIQTFSSDSSIYDAIALCYVHIAREERKLFYDSLIDALKPGGLLVMEAFTRTQLAYRSGGPKTEDLLYSQEIVEEDFQSLESVFIQELKTKLNEGKYHVGEAHVVRYVGRK
ncbi:MAG: class I SAM-dependent methyltransferase [Saprospiraceae bacterium]|nr:class I SAM-dependent methyltransferase [Saprospiraceae bacterium]